MKIALITDQHYGIRNDNKSFLDNQKKFLTNIFFPYLEANPEITQVINLGDMVDRRKYISYYTAYRIRIDFLEPLESKNIKMHWIIGNHDIYYRDTTEVNAAEQLIGNDHPNVKIYTTAQDVQFGDDLITFVPWLCASNREDSIRHIKETKSQICFGHLELNGYEAQRGFIKDVGGDNPELFRKFDIVCSGHYHHKHSKDNVHYLGTPCEFNWGDYNDQKGFHVFDTETRELTFIENPHTMYMKLFYDDYNKTKKEIFNMDFSITQGKCIKIIVKSKTNTKLFEEYASMVDAFEPIDVAIVDDHLNMDILSDNSITTEAKDTLTLFKEYISQSNNVVDSGKLDKFISMLYNEALTVDN